MKFIRQVFMLFSALVFFFPVAYADLIQGEIVRLNEEKNTFTVALNKPATDVMNIGVVPETKFDGVTSLKELRPGDEVSADVERDVNTQTWQAKSVKINKVKIRET